MIGAAGHEVPVREDVDALLAATAPCVSVFVSLRHGGVAGEHDRHRAAVLLDDVVGGLRSWGLRPTEAAAIVAPAHERLDRGPWPSVWQGLAMYLAGGLFRAFGLRGSVSDRVVIGERFLVGPLIRDIEHETGFWLLALSRNEPRLLHGDVAGLRVVTDVPLPRFAQVVAVDEAQPSVQYHRASGGAARATVAYHGHGGVKDADDARERRWIDVVADRVDTALRRSRDPLVLAGVAEHLTRFRLASRYPHTLAGALTGNPDRETPTDLDRRARPLVEQRGAEARERDLARYHERAGTGWTVTGVDDVARAVEQGDVDVLFASAEPVGDDEFAVDGAVAAVWSSGGTVHVLDGPPPGGGAVAALLRYVSSAPSVEV